jgi:hypothetical protein
MRALLIGQSADPGKRGTRVYGHLNNLIDAFALTFIGLRPNQFCRNAVVTGVNVCDAVTSIVPTPFGTPCVTVQLPVQAITIVVPAGTP